LICQELLTAGTTAAFIHFLLGRFDASAFVSGAGFCMLELPILKQETYALLANGRLSGNHSRRHEDDTGVSRPPFAEVQ